MLVLIKQATYIENMYEAYVEFAIYNVSILTSPALLLLFASKSQPSYDIWNRINYTVS